MEAKQSVTPSKVNDAKDAAHGYIDRSWSVVPVPRGEKGPKLDGWQKLRIKPEQVGEFFTEDSNIGIQLGVASGGLADVDLDCPEAEHAGNKLLPKTLTSGRGNKVRHHWYTSPGSGSVKFKDTNGDVLVEVRADGGYQTLVEPSIHPTGERYVWQNDAEPLEIEIHELRSAASRVAVSALIARHLPAKTRHDTALAYAGYVLKNLMELGEDEEDAVDYVWNILDPAWAYNDADEEGRRDLYATIEGIAAKLYAGEEEITGAGYLRDNLEHGAGIVKRIKEWLGWELSDEQREAIEERQRVKRAEKAIAEPAVSALANNPGLLKALYDRVAESVLLGEQDNAEILLLAAVALACGKPISAIIKGTSAVGKSEIIKAVTRALPPEMVVERQSMSSQSLVYMGENGQLKNKILVVYELGGFGAEGSEGLEQAKQLLSEGRISRQTVDRDESNRNTGRAIVTEGPTAMWTTTTKVKTDYELSTRVFELTPDDGQEQTGRINEKAFDYEEAPGTDFSDAHGVFTWLLGQDNRVYFPYGAALGKLIPKSAVKMRRESQRIRLLIDAHATLHQANRERDERGRIVATLDDYEAVRELMEPFVGTASEQGVKPQVRETVEAALRLLDSEDFKHDGVTAQELRPELGDNGVDRSAAYRRIQAAYPYLVESEDKRGRAKQYEMGEELPASGNVLPSKDELCNCASESRPPDAGSEMPQKGSEPLAQLGAQFAKDLHSSSLYRGSPIQKHDRYEECSEEEYHEEGIMGRGSIGLHSCTLREEDANVAHSSAKCADPVAQFVASLPPDLLPPQSDVDELRERYGPMHTIRTP